MSTATPTPPSPHLPVRPQWLALRTEEILEPELPIVDPHHHLWDRPGARYLLDEILEDLRSGHRVESTVFVQCRSMYRADGPEPMRALGEVEFVNGIAAQSASGIYGPVRVCEGIVAGADLGLGAAVEPVLEAMARAAPDRMRGIRNQAAWHPHPDVVSAPVPALEGLLVRPSFLEGVRVLPRFGLVLDVWAYHTQLEEVLALARACPDTTIVVNHLCGPIGVGPYAGRRDEVFAAWKPRIAELAALPNTVMKLGGLAMRVGGLKFHEAPQPPASAALAEAFAPWIRESIERFGAHRCMFESNFPVDKGMVGYAVLWNAFTRLAAGASADEKTALFSGCARRVYRLPAPARRDGAGANVSA